MTTFYNEKNPQRLSEYKRCIEKNLANKFIKKIYLFYENPKIIEDFLLNPKIKIIPISIRPNFQNYIDFVNTHLKKELIIISNTDIFFDETLNLLKNFSFKNNVIALTRYNIPGYDGPWQRHQLSFDSWIYKAPLNVKTKSIIGTFGSDLLFVYDLMHSDFKVINPSLNIKSWHVHAEEKRSYEKKIKINPSIWKKIIQQIKACIPFIYLK